LIGIRTPTIYHADLDRGLLVLEFLRDAPTCRDFIRNLWPERDDPEVSGILKTLASEIGSTVSRLHKNNIIHGDLTTSNILVESR
jgi:TP53 regulating kinase-like protein